MNKVNELENKMNEILQDVNIKDLSEVGYENLRNMISSISEEIEKEARLANVDILRSLTLDEMGNPKDRDAVEFDDDAFNKMASIKALLDKAEDIQIALGNEERVKKEQAHTRMHRIFAIHGEKRVISNQIKMMELQIKSERDRLAGPLISEVLKEDIKVGINDLNARIERLKEHLDTLDMEEIKLKEEIQILRDGGKLNLDFEEQKVNENNAPENKNDEELNNPIVDSEDITPEFTETEKGKNEEHTDIFPPFVPITNDDKKDAEFPPLDEEPEQEETREENEEDTLPPLVVPVDDLKEVKFKEPKPSLREKVKRVLTKAGLWLASLLALGTIIVHAKPLDKNNIDNNVPPAIVQPVEVDNKSDLDDIIDMSGGKETKDENTSKENEKPTQEETKPEEVKPEEVKPENTEPVVDTNEVHPITDDEFYLAPGDYVARENSDTGKNEATVDYYGVQRDANDNVIGTAEVDKTPGNYTIIENQDIPTVEQASEQIQSEEDANLEFFTNDFWNDIYNSQNEEQGRSR